VIYRYASVVRDAQNYPTSSHSRFIKAELKRAGVTYAELAHKLTEHGMEETEGSGRG
jgi:hypothetical protein